MNTDRTGEGTGSREEQVLEQALRAMAGGRPAPGTAATRAEEPAVRERSRVLLVAAVIGAAVGVAAALASVLVPGFPVTFP